MDVSHLLDGLNEAQRQAVSAADGNLLVLAGAGSGKTRVLVHRIAWLMALEGCSSWNILAVTFTNKAAREMRHRIHALAGEAAERGMWVGTFHGLAHRLLKAHWREAGLPENFQILDSDDQLRLIKRVSRELDLEDSEWPARQSQWFINACKDEGRRAAHIDPGRDPMQKTLQKIYARYEEQCEQGGLVDFGELLLRSHELWLKNPALLHHYQQRFRQILVDEFQDTNTIQYAWLRLLAGTSAHVTAVGDDDQSIYGWRGARIENIHQFQHDFAGTQLVRLEQNYRSTQTILKAANALIARNTGRLGKNLWSDGNEGEPIDLYAAFNELDEARYVLEDIQQHIAQGGQRSDVAILYRSNAQSRVLEEALLRAGIPYRVYGGQRFYERLEIRNALAYLRLIAHRDDDAAFERVVNVPPRGIGNKTLETLREAARDRRVSLWASSRQLLAEGRLPGRAANAVQGFLELVDALEADTEGLALEEQAEHVIATSGLVEFHKNEKGEKGQARVENLEELVSACRVFEAEDKEQPVLLQFLSSASLDAGEQQASEFEDSVQMMTLHSAKGLEFPKVFITGMEEELFPHHLSMDEPGRLEEERRLCYVGITRAMQHLTLSYAEVRRLHGQETFNAPSRFLRELPAECLREIRFKGELVTPATHHTTGMVVNETAADGLILGQQVRHPKFGEGVVTCIEGQGKNARIQVHFSDAGSKWLILHMARLEPLPA
ncbi:MAG: DNA helicase II [Gammaproteobacteria bacterium]|nr:MAG: DNA helicase II [Gammaproteobacteria bacterium]